MKRGRAQGDGSDDRPRKHRPKKRVSDYGAFMAQIKGLSCMPRNLTLQIGAVLFEMDHVVSFLKTQIETTGQTLESISNLAAEDLESVLVALQVPTPEGEQSREDQRQQLKNGILKPCRRMVY